MKIYIILPIIAFLVNGFTFTYVYAQKTFSKESKAYLLYSSVLAMWIAMQIYEMLPIEFLYPKMIFKLDTACWITIGCLFLNFIYKFLDKKIDLAFYFFAALVFAGHVLNLSTDLLISGWRLVESGLRGQEGPLYIYTAIAVTVSPCVYALALIFSKSRKVKEFNEKKQLQMLFWGSALTVLIGSVFDLFISFKPPFNTGYTSTPTIVVLQSFLIFLAIIRYKFLTLSVSDIANEIFYSIEEAVMILNCKGQIVTCNLSAQNMFQISGNEYDGMHISKLLPQFDYQNVSNLEFSINLNGGIRFLAEMCIRDSFRMAIDMEAVVGASLIAAVFMPFGLTLSVPIAFVLYLLKIVFIVFILAVSRTIFARLRIDQMVDFCWKYLAPAAFLQFLICLIVKGVLL